jgi:hypothetical protein
MHASALSASRDSMTLAPQAHAMSALNGRRACSAHRTNVCEGAHQALEAGQPRALQREALRDHIGLGRERSGDVVSSSVWGALIDPVSLESSGLARAGEGRRGGVFMIRCIVGCLAQVSVTAANTCAQTHA